MTISGEPTSVTATEPNFAAAGATSAQPAETATAAPPRPSYIEEVQKLEERRRAGAISEYDYNKAKFQILERERFGQPGSGSGDDVIGVGRYVLSFVLAGLIGLGIAYLLRNQGWVAIAINAAIFVVLVIIFATV